MAADNLSFNLGLAQLPEIQESSTFPEFVRIYNAIKIVAEKADVAAGTFPGANTSISVLGSSLKISGILFSADVSPGEFIQFHNVSGETNVKKSAFDTVHGFCSSPEVVVAGTRGEVTLFGIYPYGGGAFTILAKYEGFTTPGQIAPAGTTASAKYIGYAITPDLLLFTGGIN